MPRRWWKTPLNRLVNSANRRGYGESTTWDYPAFLAVVQKAQHFAIGTVLTVGVVAGVILWGGFNTAMEYSNTESFCIGCHEMENNVYQEYVGTVHYNNSSGVRATCPDCHVPKEWAPKMVRKIQASKELYAKALGLVDTPQKFEDHRFEMAPENGSA